MPNIIIMSNFNSLFKNALYALSFLLLAMNASCDNAIYDYEGDCDVNYALKLRWDYNMLFTDAFHTSVGSVAVYAFDKTTGKLAWQFSEKGDKLKDDNYLISLEGVNPGNYDIVTWCGLENDGTRDESFSVPKLTIGESTMTELHCRMEREIREDGSHHSSTDLYPLFHGLLKDVEILDDRDEKAVPGDHIYTVNLKKDTNHIRIILQQLSGEDVNADEFTYTIEESNGWMGHDNELLDDNVITYHEWQKKAGVAGIGFEDYPVAGSGTRSIPNPVSDDLSTRTITDVKVAIADLTIARLKADRRSILTIRNNEGEVAASIPLTDYALLIKDCYNQSMNDQEYLDRQDEYTLTFFLDPDKKWAGAKVVINSWRVIIDNVEFH